VVGAKHRKCSATTYRKQLANTPDFLACTVKAEDEENWKWQLQQRTLVSNLEPAKAK